MKKMFKQLAALMLALILALSFSPTEVRAAASLCGKLYTSSSGNVYSVLYPGATPRKARYTINSTLVEDKLLDTNDDFVEYRSYQVEIRINRSNLSKKDIINSRNDCRRKDTGFQDYKTIIIDKDGDPVYNITVSGGFRRDLSSPGKRLKAKDRKKTYYLNDWQKETVYVYRVLIPDDHDPVYFGVVGLRNGQLTNRNKKLYREGRINFFNAGYGSTKRGYAYVRRIN